MCNITLSGLHRTKRCRGSCEFKNKYNGKGIGERLESMLLSLSCPESDIMRIDLVECDGR